MLAARRQREEEKRVEMERVDYSALLYYSSF